MLLRILYEDSALDQIEDKFEDFVTRIADKMFRGEKLDETDLGDIKRHPRLAGLYAHYVLKKRWPEAEDLIRQDPWQAYHYARDVIKGRWPEAEEIIIQHYEDEPSILQWYYVRDVVKGRWPEGEAVLKQDRNVWRSYKRLLARESLR